MDAKWIFGGLILVLVLVFFMQNSTRHCTSTKDCKAYEKCCETTCKPLSAKCLPLAYYLEGCSIEELNGVYHYNPKITMYSRVRYTDQTQELGCLYKDPEGFWTFGLLDVEGNVKEVVKEKELTDNAEFGIYEGEPNMKFSKMCHAYTFTKSPGEFLGGDYIADGRIYQDFPVWKNGYGKILYKRYSSSKGMVISSDMDPIDFNVTPDLMGGAYLMPQNSFANLVCL
jgi:hypothetical protein